MKSKNLHVGRWGWWGRAVWAWGPVGVWTALLFALSALSGSQIPGPQLPGSDKLVHASVYAVLGALCFRAIRKTTALTRGRSVILALALATAYGATDELHQLFVPDRSADVLDLFADAVGSTAGALGAAAWSARRRSRA